MTRKPILACGEIPAGYTSVGEAARILGLTPHAITDRITQGHMHTVTVPIPVQLIPTHEVERMKAVTIKVGRRRAPEPDRELDPVAWNAWATRQKQTALKTNRRREQAIAKRKAAAS